MNSNLQIISGRWRGKKLHLPSDARPTQNKARIALFNILGTEDSGLGTKAQFQSLVTGPQPRIIWDAFAGSGAFGLECLSRWSDATAIFTDTSPDSIKTIKKNLADLHGANAAIAQTDAIAAIKKYGAAADLIFIDPPYSGAATGVEFVRQLAAVAKPGAILIWEMEKDFTPPKPPENLKILKEKIYGRARFLIMTNQ